MPPRLLVRPLCWVTTALFVPSGTALLALALTREDLLRLPHASPHALEAAGIAVGSVWLLVGAACGVLAATLEPRARVPLPRERPGISTV